MRSSSANRPPPEGHRGSRSEFAYQRLRDSIQDGSLKPGQRLMELEVADWLSVSRTPVRDALRRLESEGMLEHAPHNGLVVAQLDRQAVMELYVMREVLEATAAGLCARQASDIEVEDIADMVRHEEALQGKADELARHNRRFHEAIHRGAHNRYLEKSLVAVNDSMWLLGKSQMLLAHRARIALSEHGDLARAIQQRDPAAAEAAARKHVRSAQRERLKLLFPQT